MSSYTKVSSILGHSFESQPAICTIGGWELEAHISCEAKAEGQLCLGETVKRSTYIVHIELE